MEFYYIENDTRKGPLSKEEIMMSDIRPDTMVWHTGMSSWTRADEIESLKPLFHTQKLFYAMLSGVQTGPDTPQALVDKGVTGETPVWCDGMPDWQKAAFVPAFANILGSVPPSFGHAFAPGSAPLNSSRTPIPHTNWLPWAITGTVLGALTCCLGLIFGIIGIVQANKANDAYALGDKNAGDSANSSAQTMTIISLVIAILGIIGSIAAFLTGTLASLLPLAMID